MSELGEELRSLTGKARRLLAKNGQVGEENTKAVLVEPMLQALGWATHDLEEVCREYRYKTQDNPVDYALLVSGKARLFVEVKSIGRDLGQHKWRAQAVNYANTAGVEWCVLTDGNFWQVYKSNASGDLEQKLFLETWLHSPEGKQPPYEAQYVLALLARDKLVENEIQTLWQVLNIDRKGREALLGMVETKNPSIVRLIRKWSGLTRKQVEEFLDRAEVVVETPPVSLGTKPMERGRKRGTKSPGGFGPRVPTQTELEVPLLKAVLARGGVVQTKEERQAIDAELAQQFRLTEDDLRLTITGKKYSRWSNRIRWVRLKLVQKGDLDGSQRGVWRLTEQGRRRAEQD